MSFDMHTHSVCSDGTLTPAAVVQAAADLRPSGLAGIALTDHDTTAGWDEACAAAAELDVTLVRGTEVSCESGSLTVHLLSYLHRPDDPAFCAELERSRKSRLGRAERMVQALSAEFPITWADVLRQVAPGATVGRPHIADALVAAGVFSHRDDAFVGALSVHSPYYVPYYAPDPVTTIGLIRGAGGVPVLAHGLAAKRGCALSHAQIEEFVDAGLAGVEVHHREHGPAEQEWLAGLAARRGLIVTGASDFHGAGKRNLLGENQTDRANLDRIASEGALEVVWSTADGG